MRTKTNEVTRLLRLNKQTIVDRIIPKNQLYTLLSVTNEKKLVRTQLEKLHWLASFKPSKIKVPATDDISEIEVFFAEVYDLNQAKKIFKIIGKIIPYPLVILFTDSEKYLLMGANYSSKKSGFLTVDKLISSPVYSEEKVKEIVSEIDWNSFMAINLGTYYKGILNFISLTNFSKEGMSLDNVRNPEKVLTLKQEIKGLENRAKQENQLKLKIDILKQVAQKKMDLEKLLKGGTTNE